ncbi:RluA family pseudouridine synthase [Rickettsiales bacterium]|nr:RluA family pseudouridine synthase [Rickettsiales bacterium]
MTTFVKKINISPDDIGSRIEKFLAKNALGFSLAQKLIRKKQILVNDKKVKIGYKIEQGDEIIIPDITITPKINKKPQISKENITKITQNIIYQDKNIIAINKPSGVATQGGTNIKFSIDAVLPYLKFDQEQTPRLVHRLDKDTSGILLIARNRQIADILLDKFKNKQINKTYLALIAGIPSQKSGEINLPLLKKYQGKNEKIYVDENGKEAITKYKILTSKDDISLVELKPITGRTHQLRVHMKEIGHPILGDYKYGKKGQNDFSRLALHAFKIEINDYFGQNLKIESKKPDFIKYYE